jgi:hypothetical protein
VNAEELNLVLALSAGATAVATIAVAVFSIGTLRLFLLEKGKQAASWVRLTSHLGRLKAETDTMVRVAVEAIGRGQVPDIQRFRSRLKKQFDHIARAWEYASTLGNATILSHLHVAQVVLDDGLDSLGDLERAVEASDGSTTMETKRIIDEEILPRVRQCAKAVAGAYDAIPSKNRNLDGVDYAELLDQAAENALSDGSPK